MAERFTATRPGNVYSAGDLHLQFQRIQRAIPYENAHNLFDPRWGVRGNGTTDDTDAVRNALAAAAEEGRPLVALTNTAASIKITGALSIPSHTTLDLNGTTLKAVGNFRPLSVIGADGSPVTNVHLRNIRVECSSGATNQAGLSMQYVEDSTWENIEVVTPGLNGIEMLHCARVHGRVASVSQPSFFGIFYYDCEDCSDADVYVYQPVYWAHQFKSSERCVSHDIVAIEPQNEHGLYMWTGFGVGTPGPRINKECGYVRPTVIGAATSKHLIYFNAVQDCYVEHPRLTQVSGGWTPISVGGENTATVGGSTVDVWCRGIRITNPQITCAGNTQAVSFGGSSTYPITDCVVSGGRIIGGGDRPLYFSYTERTSVEDVLLDTPTSMAVTLINSRVQFRHVRVLNGTSGGWNATSSSVAECWGCSINGVTASGGTSDSTSRLAWHGGRVYRAVSAAFVLGGVDDYVGDGAQIVDARYGAGSFQSAIRLTGSRATLRDIQFSGDTTWLDSYVKESGSASGNRVGTFTKATALSNDVVLLAGSGSVIEPRTNVVAKTSAYTASSTDHTILGNATSAAFTVTLPAAGTCTQVTLVIKKTDASANAVTVDGSGSETIDGALTYALSTQYQFVTVQSDGSNWQIVGKG